MVSNFQRIFVEIKKGAHEIAPIHELEAEAVVKLIMDIVDLEDQNRVRAVAKINQKVRTMIENAAQSSGSREDA